jgi:hypothetical protein
MKLFYFRPKKYEPIQILVSKIENEKELIKLEELTSELFQYLYDQKEASSESILIFSIIKDYNHSTENLILPSTNSSPELVQRCHENTDLLNGLIVDTLTKTDCEYYFEFKNDKILHHPINLNLGSLGQYYSFNK